MFMIASVAGAIFVAWYKARMADQNNKEMQKVAADIAKISRYNIPVRGATGF
jgi:hypothetical protein